MLSSQKRTKRKIIELSRCTEAKMRTDRQGIELSRCLIPTTRTMKQRVELSRALQYSLEEENQLEEKRAFKVHLSQ